MKNLFIIALLSMSVSGCLATRDQLKSQDSKRDTQQQVIAQQQAQFSDFEAEIRTLNGRIASLENSLGTAGAEKRGLESRFENERAQMEARLKIYEDALTKMEQQYLAVSQKVEALQMSGGSSGSSGSDKKEASAKPKGKVDFFAQGEEEFKKKNFRQAIVSYQKYREANAKGSSYAEATYKMGLAFQELKMRDEATPFFNEVVEKFPKSKAADKAKLRLKKK
jgi:TolA-binding protein